MRTTTATFIAIFLALPAAAHAGDEPAVLVDATMIEPLGEEGRVSSSFGYGTELRLLPNREPFLAAFGAWYGIGVLDGQKTMRDMYDFHFDIGLKPERTQGDSIYPFGTIGLDVLHMVTRDPDGPTYRGTTLGLHARVGAMGSLGKRWYYSVSIGYLGAIVPGTGDDLGGLVMQAGLGFKIDD